MENYLSAVNRILVSETASIRRLVVYGENINKGSCIVGVARGLKVHESGRIINVGNCESTHCGLGFGLMMKGISSILFVKQLDFMLLGMDHFVNTYNIIRCHREASSLGSFTIVTVVCDQGYQGPQSSFNALGDICSLAQVPGYTLTNEQDASLVLKTQLQKPGFRFIALSQRLFPAEITRLGTVYQAEDASLFQYSEGKDVTIVCFNFSLPEGVHLQKALSADGLGASLFSVNAVPGASWKRILESARKTQNVVVLDDSKSTSQSCFKLFHEISTEFPSCRCVAVTRDRFEFGVCPDNFELDENYLVKNIRCFAKKIDREQ